MPDSRIYDSINKLKRLADTVGKVGEEDEEEGNPHPKKKKKRKGPSIVMISDDDYGELAR